MGIPVLDPKGAIGLAERALMIHAVEYMLIVAVPVFVLLFFFAWWYRAGNTKAKYVPDWAHAKMDELIWWAIPFEIILILGALTWGSTHTLDPRVPIETAHADNTPLVIEVVALPWKWLFIYPEQNIATINYARIPVGRPVRFDITADAPMNSFWVPQLGGQIYAMTGMVNSLNLIADEVGTYKGVSANYSGVGFAQMKFSVQATPQEDFDSWIIRAKASSKILTDTEYEELRLPGEGQVTYYAEVREDFYNSIVGKFIDQSHVGHTH